MRFPVDNSLSWRIARDLRSEEHDAIDIADLGLASADDPIVYARAVAESRTLLTQDSDFGPIHAASNTRTAVMLIRLTSGKPRVHSQTIAANLPQLEPHLKNEAFIIIADGAITIQHEAD